MDTRVPKVTVNVKRGYCGIPTLEMPNPFHRFYIKTYWFNNGMEEVLI